MAQSHWCFKGKKWRLKFTLLIYAGGITEQPQKPGSLQSAIPQRWLQISYEVIQISSRFLNGIFQMGWCCFELFTFRRVWIFLLRNIILVAVCWGRRHLLFCFLFFFWVHTTIMISILKITFWRALWGLRCSKPVSQNSELEKPWHHPVHLSAASSLPQAESKNCQLIVGTS